MDTPLDLTGRYKEKTIHKFLKDDILDIIRSQNAVFKPFFDPETYPDLELIIVDGKIRDSYLPVAINRLLAIAYGTIWAHTVWGIQAKYEMDPSYRYQTIVIVESAEMFYVSLQ